MLSNLCICQLAKEKDISVLTSHILSEVEHHFMFIRAVAFPFLKTVHVLFPFLFSMCSFSHGFLGTVCILREFTFPNLLVVFEVYSGLKFLIFM